MYYSDYWNEGLTNPKQ